MYVTYIIISPNGQILASGSDDYAIKLWNLCTGKLFYILEGDSSNVNSITFDIASAYLSKPATKLKLVMEVLPYCCF